MITIALDPGHPSREGNLGATVPGMVEADETLGWCRYIHRHVAHSCEPMSSFLVRSRADEVVSLEERGQRAIDGHADFALAIHINAWHTEAQSGAGTYYAPGDSVGRDVADTILRCMPDPLARRTRVAIAADPSNQLDKWLEAPLAVLEPYRKRLIPAVLLEVGFMTHGGDYEAMRDPSIQFGVLAACLSGFARARLLMPSATYAPFAGIGDHDG